MTDLIRNLTVWCALIIGANLMVGSPAIALVMMSSPSFGTHLLRHDVQLRSEVKLSISSQDGGKHELELSQIKRLPGISFRAIDPWGKSEHLYKGASLIECLKHVGINRGKWIDVIAENGYEVSISWADAERIGHILAYEMDGVVLSEHPRGENKAPLMIAIFFDETINQEIYKHHLVWMVKAINVRND